MAKAFEFVVSDPASNPKPGKSLQIRSRCMQGKNIQVDSRRSRRARRRQLDDAKHAVVKPARDTTTFRCASPRQSLSDISTVQLADRNINLDLKCLVLKAFASDITDPTLSPLDCCVNFESIEQIAFEWLCSDTAFLHSVLTTACAVQDFKSPQWDGDPSSKTTLQLHKTLSLLQKNMSNEDAYRYDSVLYAVLNLAVLAAGFGDWAAAITHLTGLQKIVQMRGDQDFLRTRPKLHFKLDRIDLIWTLSSGKQPFFQRRIESWDPILPAPPLILALGLYSPPTSWDIRLVNVFSDLQHLSLQMNRSARTQILYDGACFQAVLASIQARLMRLATVLEGPVEELLRLSMLAFLIPMFNVPGQKMPYQKMIKGLRAVYAQLSSSLFEQDRSLTLWIVMLAASVSGAQEAWVQEAWTKIASGLAWSSVKDLLMQVIWIEIVHDHVGEMAFEQLKA